MAMRTVFGSILICVGIFLANKTAQTTANAYVIGLWFGAGLALITEGAIRSAIELVKPSEASDGQ